MRTPIREQVEQLNAWLAAIWDEPLRLSAALRLGGLADAALAALRPRLEEYLPQAQAGIATLLYELFPMRQASLVLDHFGLTGAAPESVHELAARHGISRAEAARFIRQAMRRMQPLRRRVALLHTLVDRAAEVLGLPAPARVTRRVLTPIRRREQRARRAEAQAEADAPAAQAPGAAIRPAPRGPLRAVPRPGGPGQRTYENTLELFQQGMAPEAIAAARGLSFGTIATHLARWLSRGVISLDALVTPEQRTRIEAAHTRPDMTLRELKERLPDLDYGIIKWVLAAQSAARRAERLERATAELRAAPPASDPLALLNRWLSEVWGRPLDLEHCLSLGGLSLDELPALRSQMAAYLPQAFAAIIALIQAEFEPRNASILIRRCGLDGAAPDDLSALGAAHGISRERVRQISLKLTQRMRGRARRAALLTVLAREAALLLGQPAPAPVDPATQVPVRRATQAIAPTSGGDLERPTSAEVRAAWAAALVAAHGGPVGVGEPLAAVTPQAQDSYTQTFDLFWQGLDPTAIAEARDLARSTIERHLAWLIEAGVIDWRALVTPEQRAHIDAAQVGARPPHSVLAARLPGISYAMLGWIAAARRREAALERERSVGG